MLIIFFLIINFIMDKREQGEKMNIQQSSISPKNKSRLDKSLNKHLFENQSNKNRNLVFFFMRILLYYC